MLYDLIIRVLEAVAEIVADRARCSRFDFEDEGFSISSVRVAVNLWAEEDLVIQFHETMVIFECWVGGLFGGETSLEFLPLDGELPLHDFAHIHQDLAHAEDPIIGVHRVDVRSIGLNDTVDEIRDGFALWNHELPWLIYLVGKDLLEVGTAEPREDIVDLHQEIGDGGRRHSTYQWLSGT